MPPWVRSPALGRHRCRRRGGGRVGNSLGATEAADILAILGAVLVAGSMAATETADAASVTGKVGSAVSGTMAATEAADGASVRGAVLVAGTLGATDQPDAAAMSGAVGSSGISGTMAATDGADAAGMAGGVLVSGTMASTDAPDAAAISGSVPVSGSLAATDGADTASMSGTVANAATTQRLAPDAIAAATNLSGAVTAIQDDPDSPDGAWLTAPDTSAGTAVRVTFPTPTNAPQAGSGLQEFRARVRKAGGAGTPSAAMELWENGALVASLATGVSVTSTTGQVLSATWDAALVSGGANVEARIAGTGSGGKPADRSTVEVGAIEWNAYG